jgi:hypothetical protein
VGKLVGGGWFGGAVVDEAAKEEQFEKDVLELVERFPDCPSALAGRFLKVRDTVTARRDAKGCRSGEHPIHLDDARNTPRVL